MGTTRSAVEVKKDFVASMGEQLGPIFHALWQEVAALHEKWGEFVALYGTKESRVRLMNEAAPAFFGIVQTIFWENILLHIARLTDPPGSSRRANLTIRQFDRLVDDTLKIETLTARALQVSEFCRDWRNRHIAHCDRDLALNDDAEPFSEASRLKVGHALAAIVDVLNAIS